MLFGFPERLFPRGRYSIHRMRVFTLAISWISIIYNGIEGGVSIGLGAEVASRALIVFGVQSGVEVLSAALVIYRFRRELADNSLPNLILERRATLGIGILTIGTWAASIVALATHSEPDSSKPALIVSACSLVFMIFVWLPKPWIATELNSSVMRGEAACSLACIYLTIVLFIGSLVYKLWHGGWWVDSTVAILLGLFFLREGWGMISWARNKNFDGGCCKTCSAPPRVVDGANDVTISDSCSGNCAQTCSTAPAANSTSDNCNKNCSKTCSTLPTITCCSNEATISDSCKEDCSEACSTSSPAANSTADNCNKSCSKTCSTLPTITCCSNDATISDSCKEDCSETCSASSTTAASSSNDAKKSANENHNVEKCECCANKKECIEAGTCVCRPLLVDTIRSNHISCCFGPTKCCIYGSTALFRF